MTDVRTSRLVARVLVEQEPPPVQATRLLGRFLHVAAPPVQASRLVLRVMHTGSIAATPAIGGQMYPRGGTRSDVTPPGGAPNLDAALIRGIPVSETQPTDGQLLRYDATLGQWVPSDP